MKKYLLTLIPFVLAACSTPQQQSTVPMDMQTVQDYQQRVASGNTADKYTKPNEATLNQSDRETKVIVRPVVRPSVGIGYGWGRYHHSGIGVNLGSGYWY